MYRVLGYSRLEQIEGVKGHLEGAATFMPGWHSVVTLDPPVWLYWCIPAHGDLALQGHRACVFGSLGLSLGTGPRAGKDGLLLATH